MRRLAMWNTAWMGALALAYVLGEPAHAYKEETHSGFSQVAANLSVLGTGPTLADLNLSPLASTSMDYVASTGNTGNALAMISIGAINEDKQYFTRALNHFYDPQYANFSGRGLTVAGVTIGWSSPTWAIEDLGDVTDLHDSTIAQTFSYRSAEQDFYLGMTSSSRAQRLTYFGAMFQSLGQVIHHIQDMGQPQHTRNDIHPLQSQYIFGFYEDYAQRVFAAGAVPNPQAVTSFLTAHPYPAAPPDFATARQYWYTPGVTSATYIGMSEFTSENFASRGAELVTGGTYPNETIGPNPNYPYPNGTGMHMQYNVPVTVQSDSGQSISGLVDFVIGSTIDQYSGQATNGLRLAASSLLDPYRRTTVSRPLGENTAIFDDELSVLVPRAVTFSTGLINHFFRGRLNLRRASAGGTTWYIDNTSTSPNAAMVGTFSVFSEDASGSRTKLPEGPWSLSIAQGGTASVVFGEPPASTKNLVVVFEGPLGNEPSGQNTDTGWYAVAGKVVSYTAPTQTCTAPRSDTGSSAGITYTRDLGPIAGQVELQFEAYAIPDGVQVTYVNGHTPAPIAYTGLVSGFHDLTFNYDPAAAGTQQVQLKVTGNSDTNTAWTTDLGCPGQPINGGIQRERVVFNYGTALQNAVGSCTADVYVDGVRIGTAIADINSPHSLAATLSKVASAGPAAGSQHALTYANFSCAPNTSNILTGGTYTDALGAHPVSGMSDSAAFYFEVN